jgi:hypothetical protein
MCVFDYKVKVEKYPGGKKNFGGKNQKIKKVFFRRSVDNIRAFPEVPSLRLPQIRFHPFPRPTKKAVHF